MDPGFTNVIVAQPPAVQNGMLVTGVDGHRGWNSELFGCLEDCGSGETRWCLTIPKHKHCLTLSPQNR